MHDDYSLGHSSASRKAKAQNEQQRQPDSSASTVDTEQMKRLGGFSGKVYDKLTYRTITGARVTIATDLTVRTDEKGNFRVAGIRPGNYRLRVDEEGYIVQSRRGIAVAGEITTVNAFHLIPDCLAAERPEDAEEDDTGDGILVEFALDSSTEITPAEVQAPTEEDGELIVSTIPSPQPNERVADAAIETKMHASVGVSGSYVDTAASPERESEIDAYETALLMSSDSDAVAAEEIIAELIEQANAAVDLKASTRQENVTPPAEETVNRQSPSLHTQKEHEPVRSVELLVEEPVPELPELDETENLPHSVSSSETPSRIGKVWKSLRKKIVKEPDVFLHDGNIQPDQSELPLAQAAIMPDAQSALQSAVSDGLPHIAIDQKIEFEAFACLLDNMGPIAVTPCCRPEHNIRLDHPHLVLDRQHNPTGLPERIALDTPAPAVDQNVSSTSIQAIPIQEVLISEYPAPVRLAGSDATHPPVISETPEDCAKVLRYQTSFITVPCVQTDNGSLKDALLFRGAFEVMQRPNIENHPPLPCVTPEIISETTESISQKDTESPLRLVKEPLRIRRRMESSSAEESSREGDVVNSTAAESSRVPIDPKTQPKLLWWTKRGRRNPDLPQQESDMALSGTSVAEITTGPEQQIPKQQFPETIEPEPIPDKEKSTDRITAFRQETSESVSETGTEHSQTGNIDEEVSCETDNCDPSVLNEQEKEAMSPNQPDGPEVAGCAGTLQVFPNPAFKGLPITVTYQVKNVGCENTDNVRIHITIVDPEGETVLETFESQIACEKGSFHIGGFTVSTASYEAHTYRIYMHIVTLDSRTYSLLAHVPLDIRSIY